MSGIIIVRFLSLILQLIGVVIVLSNHAWFYYKAKTGKYQSVKKEFVKLTFPRTAIDDKKLQETDADEALLIYPLAGFLYKTYLVDVFGVIFTLVGVILGFFVIR